MTNKPELNPCREAFETWYDPISSQALERKGEGYILMQTQLAWAAWQAAWNTCAEPSTSKDDTCPSMAATYTSAKPAMTDAELVQEAECLASDFSAGSYDESCWGAEIFDLAKKYRG